MSSAKVDMSASAEKNILRSTYLPISHATSPSSQRSRASSIESRRATMSRIQHLCAILFAVALLAITFVNAATLDRFRGPSVEAQQFRELLETVDAATLHDILHEHLKEKYQHGVWPEDKTALEALHKENAEVAQNLVQLAKRQSVGGSGNGTVVTTTQFTEITTEVTVTSTPTPTPPPESPSPTPPEPPTDTPTPTPTPTPSPTPTPTTSSSSSTTSSSTTPSTLSTTTSSRTSSSAPSTSSSHSSRPTEEITTEIVYTTTFADGGASVVTRVTVVPANQATQPTGSRTNTANASLQTGNEANALQYGWAAGAGLVGMALMWAL